MVCMRFGLAFVLLLALPTPSLAWGFDAHRFITEQMIALLPVEIRPIFEQRRQVVVERSVDPDLWRNVFPEEAPNHFLDIDYFGKYPFAELPRDYDKAVQKWGRTVVHEQGMVPWRTAEIYGSLQREFAAMKRENAPTYVQDNIAFYAAVMSHYIGDAHVPLHAVINYDGVATNQRGVHGRWESELFDRTRSRLKVAPPAVKAVQEPRDAIFETLLASNRLSEAVLEDDRRAASGRDFYDDAYFAAFEQSQFSALERRINESISAVASFIVGAWEAAGRPAIPPDKPRAPRPTPRPKG
jgi:hypothetical protein